MRVLLSILLLAPLTFAQAAKPQATTPPPASPSASAEKTAAVPPSAAVVTIPGFCPGKSATGAECKTEISREDFEKLANALKVPEDRKRDLASGYAQLLVVDHLAEERGLTKRPDIQELLQFSRMQNLAQLLVRDVREQASKVDPADIQKYYDEHKAEYTQATLERIFIPKLPPGSAQKVDESVVKAEGAKIAAAAKAPDADFTKLQKQAYEDLKITATPPPTELKDVRRDNVPQGQQKAFDLNAGQVSDAIDEPGGIYIYKVTAKKTLSQGDAESDIRAKLEQERFQAAMSKLMSSVKPELNDAYFGPAPTPQNRPAGETPRPGPASKAPAAAPRNSATPRPPK